MSIQFILKHLNVQKKAYEDLLENALQAKGEQEKVAINQTLMENDKSTIMSEYDQQRRDASYSQHEQNKLELADKVNKIKMKYTQLTGITHTDLTAIINILGTEISRFRDAQVALVNPLAYVTRYGSETTVHDGLEELEEYLYDEATSGWQRDPVGKASEIDSDLIIHPVLGFNYDFEFSYQMGELEHRDDPENSRDDWVLFCNEREIKSFGNEDELLEYVRDELESGDDIDEYRYEMREVSAYVIEEMDNGKFELSLGKLI